MYMYVGDPLGPYSMGQKTVGRAALPFSMEGHPFRDRPSPPMRGVCMASTRVAGPAPASVEAASD